MSERQYAWVCNDHSGDGWWLIETATEDRSLAYVLALDAVGWTPETAAVEGIELDVMRAPAFDGGAHGAMSGAACEAIVGDLYRARRDARKAG